MLPFSESLLSLIPPPDNSSTGSIHVCSMFTSVACRPGAVSVHPWAAQAELGAQHSRPCTFVLYVVGILVRLWSYDFVKWKTSWILL